MYSKAERPNRGSLLERRQDLFDRIGEILTAYKNDDSRSSRLEELGLSGEEIDGLLDLSPAKYQRVSLKAMRKMQPYLEDGLIYDKACEAAGYDFRALNDGSKKHLLKGEEINAIVNDITKPLIKRLYLQTIKVHKLTSRNMEVRRRST